ncbi:MAG: AarF/UbiB family protein [Spirochaetes bacterium]|nr:AarF/UbiB family protein [Spirochaetota bacterium]
MNVRKRFFKTAILVFKIVLDFKKEFILIKKKGYIQAQIKMRKTHEKRAKQLYHTAVYMQGAFIKACQYLSARPDVFPEPYIKILSSLQDDVPPEKFENIMEVINREFSDWSMYFTHIEERPIASASLAQVHMARLLNGNAVILKILKPGVENIIDIDLAILDSVLKLLLKMKIFRDRPDFINFSHNMMNDFVRVTGDELNFKREAQVARQFREQFKKFNFVKVPYVYEEISTCKIIVMEYIKGDKIFDIDKWQKRNNDPQLIAKRLIELYVDQFLFSKLIHYDPHPGNIIITNNSNIVLLDFGMSGEITEKMRNGFWIILEAAVIRDFRKIIDVLDDLGFIQRGYNKYALLPIIEFFFDKILDVVRLDRESLHAIDFTPIRDDLLEIMDHNAFSLPPNWAFSGKTVSTLYGIIGKLNPDFKIYEEIKSTAFSILRNNMNLFLQEIATRIYEALTSNLFTLLTLPGKIDGIIDNIERGKLKIKIEDKELIKKIDETQIFLFILLFLATGIFTGLASYIFYANGRTDVCIVLAAASFISFLISLIYRGRKLKDRLRKQMEKMF